MFMKIQIPISFSQDSQRKFENLFLDARWKVGSSVYQIVSEEVKLFCKPQLGLIPPPWGRKEVLGAFMETQAENPWRG